MDEQKQYEVLATQALEAQPTPTEWLDITARNGGLCVAWNSDRYLLTDAQARKLRDTLSTLLSEVKD